MHRVSPLIAASLIATASARPSWSRGLSGYNDTDTNSTAPEPVYTFSDIEPSETLTWVRCFDDPKLSCANLLVPLDYEDPSAGQTNIAWIKYVSSDDTAEDILYNPGGPGVSGIDHLKDGGEGLLANFGLQYNIVSFDPRGVNNSGPSLTCFPDDPETKKAYKPTSKTAPLQEIFQGQKAVGEYCSTANAETNAKYGGSVATAQDIMHFVDLRAAEKGSSGPIYDNSTNGNTTYANVTGAPLWYYGVSYGTVLGQTLAALYPDRIGRMVLDGNVDGTQHYTGVLPSDVDDTDAAFHSFFSLCFEAGPEKCAFHNEAQSVEEIENRYLALLQNLRELPAVHNAGGAPGVLTDFAIVNDAFQRMYSPMESFLPFAEELADIEKGLINEAFKLLQGGDEASTSSAEDYDSGEATPLITCIDANKNYPIKTLDDWLDAREVYKKESYYAGDNSALTNLLFCVGLDITPPPSQQFPGFDPTGTQTSFPILFVNPIRDPITPLTSAHKMSALFPGSVVLAQDSTGHGIAGAESACTKGYLQAYMQQGTLPAPDTVCIPDVKPFIDAPTKRSIAPKAHRLRRF